MLRFLKLLTLLVMLGFGSRQAHGFALLGPFDPLFQVPSLSYNVAGDIGGPMNLGDEYRWNTPTLYYAFDQNFLDYFGAEGVKAVDEAIGILNALTNVSSYSDELSEFPLDSLRVNYKAQSLQLVDVRTMTLHLLVEQLGLAEPDRFTWTLRQRVLPPGATCPAYLYTVIKRNFDPVTWEPTSYVNGTLYTYSILELCTAVDQADAVEIPVDPLSNPLSAVASQGHVESWGPFILDTGPNRYGFFSTGLTRDDAGGLRYLYRASNVNFESVAPNALQYVTNANPQFLTGSNLTLLAAQALTNSPAQLQALYPGLVITSSSNFVGLVATTNVTAFFTNAPWSPAGVFTIGFTTNVTFSVQTRFTHVFANLVAFQLVNGQYIAVPIADLNSIIQPHIEFLQSATVTITNQPWLPAGNFSIVTDISSRPFVTNVPTGEFFILPTNVCDLRIIAPLLTNVVATTNFTSNLTNAPGGSNIFIGQVLSFQQFTVDFSTNHTFIVLPINCLSNTVDLRQGVEKITFVRHDYDSLIGRTFTPVTNIYTLNGVTNSQVVTQTFRREVTQPDILFTAADIGNNGTTFPPANPYVARSIFAPPHVDIAQAGALLPGPGTIQPPAFIIFNKVGPIFLNNGPFFIDEATGLFLFQWGSFDGTTNEPIVYPSGQSIRNLENQILIQIQPGSFNATVGVPLNQQITVTGGTPPYTLALAPYSPALPAGLTLSPSGMISGTPQTAGTYDFVVRSTDGGGLMVDKPISIIISP